MRLVRQWQKLQNEQTPNSSVTVVCKTPINQSDTKYDTLPPRRSKKSYSVILETVRQTETGEVANARDEVGLRLGTMIRQIKDLRVIERIESKGRKIVKRVMRIILTAV